MAITVDVTPNNTTVSPQESVTTTLDITTSIPTISAFRPLIGATDAGGDGSFAYDSSSGVFTYTGPSASEVRAHFSAGTGVTYSSGQFSIGQDVATSATPTFAAATINGAIGGVTTLTASGEIEGGSLDINGAASIAGAVTDVTTLTASGEIEGGSLDINGSASIAGAITDVTTLTASGEIEGGSLDINGAVDIDTGGSAFNVNLGSATAVITTSGTNSCLSLESTASGSTNDAPELRLRRASVPSANDQTGSIRFQSQTTGGATRTYGRILSQVKDPSNTDYKGTIFFEVQNATSSGGDSLKNVMELEPDDVKIGVNETTTNLIVNGEIEGSSLDINGNADISGNLTGVDTLTATTFSGSGASLTNLPAAQLSGAIANGVTATTQSASDNSTKVATTAYTDTAIANLVDSSPGALNTLNELAAAINDDASFSTTITNSIGTKLAKASNLSDLENAGTARTNLGLGTAATTASGDYVAATAVSTFGGTLIDDADAATARTTLGLGTAATTASGDYVAATAVSTFGGTLIDDADAATARTTLGLGTAATTASGDYVAATAVSTFGGTLIDDADAAAARTTLGLGTVATTDSTAYAPAAGSGNILTTGALDSGSITSNFGNIDIGGSTVRAQTYDLFRHGTGDTCEITSFGSGDDTTMRFSIGDVSENADADDQYVFRVIYDSSNNPQGNAFEDLWTIGTGGIRGNRGITLRNDVVDGWQGITCGSVQVNAPTGGTGDIVAAGNITANGLLNGQLASTIVSTASTSTTLSANSKTVNIYTGGVNEFTVPNLTDGANIAGRTFTVVNASSQNIKIKGLVAADGSTQGVRVKWATAGQLITMTGSDFTVKNGGSVEIICVVGGQAENTHCEYVMIGSGVID